MTGVGASRWQRRGVRPLLARISAAARENSRPKNRVSWPIITTGLRPWRAEDGFSSSVLRYCAIPCEATRTFSKVKSRAIKPRQPEVPNLIILGEAPVHPEAWKKREQIL